VLGKPRQKSPSNFLQLLLNPISEIPPSAVQTSGQNGPLLAARLLRSGRLTTGWCAMRQYGREKNISRPMTTLRLSLDIHSALQYLLCMAIVTALVKPLGGYMARVFSRKKTLLDRLSFTYRRTFGMRSCVPGQRQPGTFIEFSSQAKRSVPTRSAGGVLGWLLAATESNHAVGSESSSHPGVA
jgi:hypothetical protein